MGTPGSALLTSSGALALSAAGDQQIFSSGGCACCGPKPTYNGLAQCGYGSACCTAVCATFTGISLSSAGYVWPESQPIVGMWDGGAESFANSQTFIVADQNYDGNYARVPESQGQCAGQTMGYLIERAGASPIFTGTCLTLAQMQSMGALSLGDGLLGFVIMERPAGNVSIMLYCFAAGATNYGASGSSFANVHDAFVAFLGTSPLPAGWTFAEWAANTPNAGGEYPPPVTCDNTCVVGTQYTQASCGFLASPPGKLIGMGSGGSCTIIPSLDTTLMGNQPTAMAVSAPAPVSQWRTGYLGPTCVSPSSGYGTYAPPASPTWDGAMPFNNQTCGGGGTYIAAGGGAFAWEGAAIYGASLEANEGLQTIGWVLTVQVGSSAYQGQQEMAYFKPGPSALGVYTTNSAACEPQTLTVS